MRCSPLVSDGRVIGFACGGGRAAERTPRRLYPGACPYCWASPTLKDAAFIYNGLEGMNYVYVCSNYPRCDAYVGCRPGTKQALGTLANAELRKYRRAAHDAFDPLWRRKMERDKCSKGEARNAAYAWLQHVLNLPPESCHIAMFDVSDCRRVIDACAPYQRR